MELTQEEKSRQKMARVNKAIIEDMRDRREIKEEDDTETDDERGAIIKKIEQRRLLKLKRDNESAERAEEETRLAMQQAEWDAEHEEFEKAALEEENILDPSEIFDMFSTWDAEDGGFKDVWKDRNLRQPIIDAIDVAIRSEGRDANDWRTYEEIGNTFRSRMKAVKEHPGAAFDFEREDQINRIQAKRLREIDGDNAYYLSGLHRPEPRTQHEIRHQFASDFPDVANDHLAYNEAAQNVTERQNETRIDTGFPREDYEIYSEAGELARKRNALREMAVARGQNPEDID